MRSYLLPLSGAFAASALAALTAFSLGSGCQTRCFNSFDCDTHGQGAYCLDGRCETECFIDEDCRHPPECRDNPAACVPKGLRCNALGRCVGKPSSTPMTATRNGPGTGLPSVVRGWDDTPGTGRAFILDAIAIADAQSGFDLDGKCRAPGDCVDNALAPLGSLANDQIRQGLLGGASLLLIELAGLDEPFHGDAASLTVKIYGAHDAHDPIYPAANFSTPPGETRCCTFKINPQALDSTGQARARAPAKIVHGLLRSLAPVGIDVTLTVGAPPYRELRIEKTQLAARVHDGARGMSGGVLGGAIPINSLAGIDNPYCKVLNALCPKLIPNSSLIDLIAALFQPDIDLDGMGLDTVRDTDGDGRVDECLGGCLGAGCRHAVIPPYDRTQPWTCAERPQLTSGYSIALDFTSVAASIVAIGQY